MKVECVICNTEGEIEYGYEPIAICEGCFILMRKESTIDGEGIFYVES